MSLIEHDSSKYSGIRFDVSEEKSILTTILETIPYEYRGKPTLITLPTGEFTSVCPWSGLPDFAEIILTYIPDKLLIEMKSLKYYYTSYRNVGIYQEHATNRILEDLVAATAPLYMKIEAIWNSRGGLGTTVIVEFDREKGRFLSQRD